MSPITGADLTNLMREVGQEPGKLDSHATGLLLEHRLRQDVHRDRLGDAYSDDGLLFARDDGTPLYGYEVTRHFGELCDAAGVRGLRLHDLRHWQSLAVAGRGYRYRGLSKILGHGSTRSPRTPTRTFSQASARQPLRPRLRSYEGHTGTHRRLWGTLRAYRPPLARVALKEL
jgi:hypothetical protein